MSYSFQLGVAASVVQGLFFSLQAPTALLQGRRQTASQSTSVAMAYSVSY
jgi:hypothetical protein